MAVKTNTKHETLITGTNKDDSIENNGKNVTINAGAGNDSIDNRSASVSVDGGAGNDYINGRFRTDNLSISGGKGNDTIYLDMYSRNALILYNNGDGNDTIYGFNEDDSIKIYENDYSTVESGNDVIITVGNGSIKLIDGAYLSILNISNSFGDKPLNISVDTNNTLISGTLFDDIVFNDRGENVTVLGRDGNDTIDNTGDFVSIDAGSGNDSIYSHGFSTGDNPTIYGGSGNDYIEARGDNAFVDGGDGKDTIEIAGIGRENATVYGGKGNDSIYNFISGSMFDCGDGDDTITNNGGANVTIIGGKGNDSIYNARGLGSNDSISISGGAGNDTIYSYFSDKTTINGGTGNDLIELASTDEIGFQDNYFHTLIQYNKGDGNDSIVGFESTSTLQIGDGTGTYSSIKSGDDIIVTVGDGVITLVGAASLEKVNIKGKKAVAEKKSWTLDGTTAKYGTSSKTLASIEGAASTGGLSVSGDSITLKKSALKNKVTIGGGYEFDFASGYSSATISGSASADKITTRGNNLSINGGNGNDTFKILGNNSSVRGGDGADLFILGADKSNVITDYAAEDKISIASGTADVIASGSDVVINGKITVKGGKDKTVTYFDAAGEHNYKESSDDAKIITLTDDYDEEIYTFGDKLRTLDASAVELDLKIVGNKFANSIIGSEQNDTLEGGKANDTLTGGGGSDIFIYNSGDGNDIITDYAEEDTISIASGAADFKVDGNKVIITVSNGSNKGTITLNDAADKVISYIDKNGAKTFGDTISAVEVKGKKVTISENYTAESFDLAGYAKTMKTIDASAVTRDIKITANANANSILGGKGNDSLIGGAGNDTLRGGDGADIFIYGKGDGNDVITDYSEEDKIKITSGTAKIKKSGKDIIFTVGNGKINVKNSADKVITYIDAKGKTKYYPAPPDTPVIIADTRIILSEKYSQDSFSLADYDSSIKTVDATKVTRDIIITGNAKANLIIGGAKNNTIIGDAGDDSLQGGAGSNVFVYHKGDGNDTIVDYAAGDKISLASGSVSSASVKGDDYVFKVGKGKITLKNGADKSITVVNSKGAEKIYNASGNVAWFIEDDNNFSTDNQLSLLVEDKNYSSTIPLETSRDLFKENIFVTYSKK